MASPNPARQVMICQHPGCGIEFERGRTRSGYKPKYCPTHRGLYVGRPSPGLAQVKPMQPHNGNANTWWETHPLTLVSLRR